MDNATTEALTSFTTTVTNSISATDVLTIFGKALAAGVAIYIVQWAARKIVRTFVRALNGHIGV